MLQNMIDRILINYFFPILLNVMLFLVMKVLNINPEFLKLIIRA